jgi:Heterokaryon incompatibility protein (HET)
MWIGDAADNSDAAMNLINRYSSNIEKEKELELRYDRNLSENWRALTYLVCRPWFTRRWIVQEISLASDSIIYCGTKSTSWRALCDATMSLEGLIHQYRVHPKKSISHFRNAHPFTHWDVSDESTKAWNEGMAHIFNIEWVLKTIITQPKRPTLRQLVRIFRYKAVTDPRDAVFALFSLSKESEQAQFDIPWMTTATVKDVFLESTKLSIKMEKSLDIVCQSFGPGPCGHLPSWVPSFYNTEDCPGCSCKKSNDLTMQYQPEQAISSYNASNDTKPNVKYEGSKLIARGICIDRVHAVLERCKPGPRVRQIPRSWKEKVLSLDAIHVDEDPKPGGHLENNKSSKFDAFWRTLVTNRVPPLRKRTDAPQECGTFFKNWCKGEMLVTRPSMVFNVGMSHRESINRGIWNSIQGRRFIISETTRIGLAYKRVREGDLICILLGCSVPVILRPAVEPEHSGCYYFIGDSYIHGVMNGEAMKKLEEGKYEEQDFAVI